MNKGEVVARGRGSRSGSCRLGSSLRLAAMELAAAAAIDIAHRGLEGH
jgi:hypothetical protein